LTWSLSAATTYRPHLMAPRLQLLNFYALEAADDRGADQMRYWTQGR
jgi:hypothetical protein